MSRRSWCNAVLAATSDATRLRLGISPRGAVTPEPHAVPTLRVEDAVPRPLRQLCLDTWTATSTKYFLPPIPVAITASQLLLGFDFPGRRTLPGATPDRALLSTAIIVCVAVNTYFYFVPKTGGEVTATFGSICGRQAGTVRLPRLLRTVNRATTTAVTTLTPR